MIPRSGESRHNNVRVQNRSTKRHRWTGLQNDTSLDSSHDDDDEEEQLLNDEMYELRSRGAAMSKKKLRQSSLSYKEVSVGSNDTLASLALRYNCSMSVLKRENRLMSDQDLYALSKLRVPVLRHGLTEEQINNTSKISSNNSPLSCSSSAVAVHNSSSHNTDINFSSSSEPDESGDEESCFTNTSVNPLLNNRTTNGFRPSSVRLKLHDRSSSREKLERKFRAVDCDIRSVTAARTAANTMSSLGNEPLLPITADNTSLQIVRHRTSERLKWYDCGRFDVKTLLLVFVLVGIAVPLLFGVGLLWYQRWTHVSHSVHDASLITTPRH